MSRTLFTALLTLSLRLVSSCGTEGGNPHRQDKVKEPEATLGKDAGYGQDKAPEGDGGNQPAPGKASPVGAIAQCQITVAENTGAPGFYFELNPELLPGGVSSVTANLTRTETDPDGMPISVTKGLSEWTPASGPWTLIVSLNSNQSGTSDSTYCSADFTLDESKNSSSSIKISVTGKNP